MATVNTGVGFSIELEDCRLEHRGEHEGLPLYEALGGRVTAIAIVKNPAIEVDAIGDEKELTFTGPIMIADLKIFRDQGPNGHENCYWYFSKETISYLRQNYTGKVKIGH